jgi:glycosyltransferase involved in cell wall biosynthesis
VSAPRLSALVCIRNEEKRLADCLDRLRFADEIVVVLDRCTDGSKEIARHYTDRLLEGAWELEGMRRNAGIAQCSGDWIFEVDADERVPETLAKEIREVIATSGFERHDVPVDNYVGSRLVRWGWGASFGRSAYPGLFRKGSKTWGGQRVHPSLILTGRKGPTLTNRIDHYIDRDVSDMIRRLDSYTTARAKDLRDSGDIGSTGRNMVRFYSRFFKCYVLRKGYREGAYGVLIGICAGLYPLLSHLKARVEEK